MSGESRVMNKFTCDDKTTLVSYLYGEVDAATRQAVDAHLAQCEACADEVTALGFVRSELGLWAAPDADLDFTIVKKSDLASSNVLRPARWWQTVPAWAQAAAAILVLAAGASIAICRSRQGRTVCPSVPAGGSRLLLPHHHRRPTRTTM